ncbi:hypothetical protein J3R83DRAFT_11947 [Lanmaoa asiatica]|nr:hypothetical protein J3R83DRAFT_11947 [Lanmaoa asiatica]
MGRGTTYQAAAGGATQVPPGAYPLLWWSAMMRAALFSLVATVLAPTLAVQVPLASSHWRDEHRQAILGDKHLTEWNLDKLPNPNATDHLVFETVITLYQEAFQKERFSTMGRLAKRYHQARNGLLQTLNIHISSVGMNSLIPNRDAGISRSRPTRALKVIYFDGSSAVKIPYGSMDTQDLIAWGRLSDGGMFDERQRIQYLCKWGKDFGVDGFVRMEMDL